MTWRKTAEACANYLDKGLLAAVEGRIQVRSYDNNEGKRVYVTEVVADNVRFLERKAGEGRSSQGNDPFRNEGKPTDIGDEDLPF